MVESDSRARHRVLVYPQALREASCQKCEAGRKSFLKNHPTRFFQKVLRPTFCDLKTDVLIYKCRNKKDYPSPARRSTVIRFYVLSQDTENVEWWTVESAPDTKRGAGRRGSRHHVQVQEIRAVAYLT